ncbi:MAG: SDR family oxidoreductase [Bacillota bacterium]
MSVQGRVAVVTGGGKGIGEGIVTLLGAKGAQVVVADIDIDAASQIAGKIQEEGGQAIALKVDVTRLDDVKAMASEVKQHFGHIDILVNNAGTVKDGLIANMPEEDWDFVINLCLKGPWLCSKAILPLMKEQGYGRVVNISSRAWLGNVGQSNYSSAKAGLVGQTRALALEFAKYGITVNAVAPGLIDTPLIRSLRPDVQERLIKAQPTPIIGLPFDVAYAVLFFCNEEARYVTGQVLHVDGGKSLGARNV